MDAFVDLRQNKRLGKQSSHWWFETSSRPLWRHCTGVERVWMPWRHQECVLQYTPKVIHSVRTLCWYGIGRFYPWSSGLLHGYWASAHWAARRITAKSREVSKLRDWVLWSYHSIKLTGVAGALLPKCLWIFRAFGKVYLIHATSRLHEILR